MGRLAAGNDQLGAFISCDVQKPVNTPASIESGAIDSLKSILPAGRAMAYIGKAVDTVVDMRFAGDTIVKKTGGAPCLWNLNKP